MVIFTSGSLSRPKACIKTHRNLIWHGINRQMSGPIEPGGRELYCVPLSGIGFGNYIVSHFLSGTTIVIEPFEARATLATIQDERITYVFLPPTMLYAMLKVPDQLSFDLSSLERMPIGYELPQRMRLQLVDRFGPIFEYGYGSTEGTCSYATPNEFLEDPLCVGLVAGLDEVRVVDEKGLELPEGETGEIIARGPTVTPGYLGDPELTAQTLRDGWYHTGDLGWFGPGKYLHFAGRIKDIIKSGGMNVSAAEVEDVFADYPGVEQVSVVGVPDERWSEAVVAAIVPSEGAVLDQEELAAFAGAQLTGYKRPKRYVLLDELPRNPAGKAAKPKLRAMLTDEGVDGAPVPRAGASG
jgi:fatty-acyl-CoA synthase